MLTIATTVEEAIRARGEIRAGGTDLQERRRHLVNGAPIVDIHKLDNLKRIEVGENGRVTIGALVTIDTVARHPSIRSYYSGLAEAAGGLATPQIRLMGTMGGALLQRTRCAYFRHPAYNCFKSGGEGCPAREGPNPNGVIFDLGPCVYPHPSTLGLTLMVYDAEVTLHEQAPKPVSALYGDGTDPRHDHLVNEGELLSYIHLPPPVAGEKAAYFRTISRFEAEWPVVECLARLVIEEDVIRQVSIGVGGVAPIPLRLPQVEAALLGQPATPDTLAQAAQRSLERANPLPQTAWKLSLLAGTVLETLETALAM